MSIRPSRSLALSGLLLLLPALLLPACGETSTPGVAAEGEAQTLVPGVEEIYRVGSVEGGTWDAFSRPVAAGFDDAGNLYLLDADERRVTVVDPDGGLVRTVGQAGGGPGEFRSPVAMAVLPDGRLWVADAGHRAFLLFDEGGAFERMAGWDETTGLAAPLLPHGDDGVVYAARALPRPVRGGGLPASPSDLPVHHARFAEAERPEVVHRAWIPPREAPQVQRSGGQMRVTRALRAFEPQLHLAVLPDGALAVADSAAYRIDIVRPGAGLEERIERPVQPVAVTDRERERERERRLRELQEGSGPQAQVQVMGPGGGQSVNQAQVRAMMEAQLERLEFWPEIPVIERLAADREGRLWVRRFGGIGEPGPIEILGRDGTLRATIPAGAMEMPAAFGPGGVAAWIERDELDVPSVRVARLVDLP
jgi:hypothetical protein